MSNLTIGKNNLLTCNTKLASEWNYEKNGDLKPENFTAGSGKKVWWKCEKGHEWEARVDHRYKGVGCPYCSGRYAIKGKNDLQTVNPSLAKEWNYDKNIGLTPADVKSNSGKKVWWKCEKGHEWQATIASRNYGTGCPTCRSERHTSFPEYALIYYLEKCGINAIHSYKGKSFELDIYIPSKKIAIEYDGYYWHKNKTKKDLEKNSKCKDVGIKLYRIREDRLLPLNDSSIDFIIANKKELKTAIQKILFEITDTNVKIDLKNDFIAIENLREYTEKENSILYSNPTLVKEWNYEKNGNLKPAQFAINSGKKVWWKCSKGHEWQAVIASRNNGRNCPYCSGKKVLQGYNDLGTLNPKLAKEWSYEKNGDLKPEQFTANSGKKVWWKCEKGHEYQATIIDKNKGAGCPYCSGQKVLQGYNDLTTLNPSLAKEWNYERNEGLRPERFSAGSNKKVWWKCEKGHEWQATISNRTNKRGCPYCSGQKVLQGYNDLTTLNPSLAKEWNYKKNEGLKPEYFSAGSNKKVWWKCEKGHEWEAPIASRNDGTGCPYCSGRYAVKGETDLATLNPKLASEWNYEKNGDLKPENFTAGSGKKVWWKCEKGHEWEARVDHRYKGVGCPYCSGRYAIKGKNDLQTVNPSLAKEWNYDKNIGLTPADVKSNSGKKVWWKCEKGHEWQATIASRNYGTGCPYCSGRYAVKGETDLATLNPKLASEWNYEKNGDLKPENFTAGSNKKVWWKCGKGHEWQATIASRNDGTGCPYCCGRKKNLM